MEIKWYLHDNSMDGEIEECLVDHIGEHPDMKNIIQQLRNIIYEYELILNWDETNKKTRSKKDKK